ncbi:hypothetical protein GB928_004555 [Shinella curvata]|uniref:Uncharacterized protein n=1 Tax=Shinella curvata TaxID=1817964 RepID=A0ABT8X9N5_9HYPH|nr:hypothetical protein [Shinella curvata]MCJ8055156.1 hypothetical protein [Shinella curvata]MDO6120448.1 hypothetical protein [Shinella curvata]
MRTQSVWLKAFVALIFGPVAVTLGILGLYDMVIGLDQRALTPMATFSFALGLLFGGFFSVACVLVVIPILISRGEVSMLAAMATGATACALSIAFVVFFDAAPAVALVSLVADTLLAIGLWVIFRIWRHEN